MRRINLAIFQSLKQSFSIGIVVADCRVGERWHDTESK
ncbi:hypothetical protein NOC27_94 [Nitrosococcus oceani AFC27]|nr:hypothetical protein NOC27_94 [Nitrosococcus oceani AFC27]